MRPGNGEFAVGPHFEPHTYGRVGLGHPESPLVSLRKIKSGGFWYQHGLVDTFGGHLKDFSMDVQLEVVGARYGEDENWTPLHQDRVLFMGSQSNHVPTAAVGGGLDLL
jgi:hypothetical protein